MSTIQDLSRIPISTIFTQPVLSSRDLCSLRLMCRMFRDSIDTNLTIWCSLKNRIDNAEFTDVVCHAARVGNTVLFCSLMGSNLVDSNTIGQAFVTSIRAERMETVDEIMLEQPQIVAKYLHQSMISAIARGNICLSQRLMQQAEWTPEMRFNMQFAAGQGNVEVLKLFLETYTLSEEDKDAVTGYANYFGQAKAVELVQSRGTTEVDLYKDITYAAEEGLDEALELHLSKPVPCRTLMSALEQAVDYCTLDATMGYDHTFIIDRLLMQLMDDPSVIPKKHFRWIGDKLIRLARVGNTKVIALFFKHEALLPILETSPPTHALRYVDFILAHLVQQRQNHAVMHILRCVHPDTRQDRLLQIVELSESINNFELIEQITSADLPYTVFL